MFKSNKMINRVTSGSEPILHISGQFVGFKSMVDHSFHGFTDATCQRNMTTIARIRGILTRLWNRNHNCFSPIRRKVTRYPDVIKDVMEKNWAHIYITDSVFHLVLLKSQALHSVSCNSSIEKVYCIIRWKIYIMLFSFLVNRCKGICIESRRIIMRKVICQCIINVMMRHDISIMDR